MVRGRGGFRVTLPLMIPTIIVTFVFRLILAFKVFDEVYLLTSGGPGTSTEVISFTLYQRFFTEDKAGYGSAMSIAVIFLVCLLSRHCAGGAPQARSCVMSRRAPRLGSSLPIHLTLVICAAIVLLPVAWTIAAGFRTQTRC